MTDELAEARRRINAAVPAVIAALREQTKSKDRKVREAARRALLERGIPLTAEELPDAELGGMTNEQLRQLVGAKVWDHSERFRKVSNKYPRMVTDAYGNDLDSAAAASDDEVAERVATWEREQGLPVRDWPAIGREERDEVMGE